MIKNPPANSGNSPGEEHGNPLQYSCLGNPLDRRILLKSMGSQKSWTQLSDETTTIHKMCEVQAFVRNFTGILVDGLRKSEIES